MAAPMVTAVEVIDRAASFRHLGAAARIATLQPTVSDAARALEFAPCALMSGFERLMREITCYLSFVDAARAPLTPCAPIEVLP
jgi:hypothetical protein